MSEEKREVSTVEKSKGAYGLNEIQVMAKTVADSGLFGVKTQQEAMALMLIAQAEGRHPMMAARDYHIIDGKPSLTKDAMLARFQASGGKVKWCERTDTKVIAVFSHPSGGEVRIEWTIDMAKKAGLLSKANWQKYPRQMLSARVISEGVRSVYPAVLDGMYTPEELIDFDSDHGEEPDYNVSPVSGNKWIDADDDMLIRSWGSRKLADGFRNVITNILTQRGYKYDSKTGWIKTVSGEVVPTIDYNLNPIKQSPAYGKPWSDFSDDSLNKAVQYFEKNIDADASDTRSEKYKAAVQAEIDKRKLATSAEDSPEGSTLVPGKIIDATADDVQSDGDDPHAGIKDGETFDDKPLPFDGK